MSAPATLHRIPRPGAWWAWLLLSQLAVALLWWWLGWAWGLPALALSHLAFLLPVFLPRSPLYLPVLSRLPADDRVAWLTIDDGPSDDTVAILDALDRHGARAATVPLVSFDGLPLAADPGLHIRSLTLPVEAIAADAVAELLRLHASPVSVGRAVRYPFAWRSDAL